ncbi:unnamed protein product [Vicia faba]|uniref:Uncharacterized protein n=1 Tax=Vicia faba TaxID=3906 RepID=A0AAV1AXB9_VICFA|nr:unnamed protein product [Vicia faba]
MLNGIILCGWEGSIVGYVKKSVGLEKSGLVSCKNSHCSSSSRGKVGINKGECVRPDELAADWVGDSRFRWFLLSMLQQLHNAALLDVDVVFKMKETYFSIVPSSFLQVAFSFAIRYGCSFYILIDKFFQKEINVRESSYQFIY